MDSPETTLTPTYPQYTNIALGEGLFDQLMKAVRYHLDEEFKANRLKATDAAQVYVGAINSVLQFSTQYLLGTLLIDEQKAKLVAETEIIELQRDKIELEKDLLELEKDKLQYEIDELLPLAKLKTEADISLINKQIDKITAEISHMLAQQSLWSKQEDKIDKEIEFMTYKILTERANTDGSVADSASLIGRQKSLLVAQKYGFAGDLQAKAAKLHADYDAVYQSVQEAVEGNTLGSNATGAISSLGVIISNISGA